jgi:hypothetical protein
MGFSYAIPPEEISAFLQIGTVTRDLPGTGNPRGPERLASDPVAIRVDPASRPNLTPGMDITVRHVVSKG